jgi:hypothetical protein
MADKKNPDRDKLIVKLPPKRPSPYQSLQPTSYPDKVPAALDPMGSIYLRARTLRTLGEGQVRWWVLIAGWLIFGGGFLLFLTIMIVGSSYTLLLPLGISAIPLVSLWKGTTKKWSRSKGRNR